MKAAHYVNRHALKAEARRTRRAADRRHLSAVRRDPDPEPDDLPWARNWHVSDRWRHD